MRNITKAGKTPAAPRLASQAQTLRWIATCPFCSWQDRKVQVDTAAMLAAGARHPKGLHILLHEHPEQQLFVFGDDANVKPCQHTILLWGCCAWHASSTPSDKPQAVEFDFEHPALTKADYDLEIYLKERVIGHACGRRFMPTTPVCCRKVSKKWHEPASGKNQPRDFHLTASIYFAAEPVRLFEELPVKHAAYQAHVAMVNAVVNHC